MSYPDAQCVFKYNVLNELKNIHTRGESQSRNIVVVGLKIMTERGLEQNNIYISKARPVLFAMFMGRPG